MESFIQHRKGRTPRQIHRDVEDLKDDEAGRAGSSGGRCTTTAATIRRPTAPRATSHRWTGRATT